MVSTEASGSASAVSRRWQRLGIAAVLVIVLGVVAGKWLLTVAAEIAPVTDANFKALFFKHRHTFVELRDMMVADGLSTLSFDHVSNQQRADVRFREGTSAAKLGNILQPVGLSVDRYHQYLELMRRVGACQITYAHHPLCSEHEVCITLILEGLVPSGTQKSIDCLLEGGRIHGELVADTESRVHMRKGDFYVPIEADWYIHKYNW